MKRSRDLIQSEKGVKDFSHETSSKGVQTRLFQATSPFCDTRTVKGSPNAILFRPEFSEGLKRYKNLRKPWVLVVEFTRLGVKEVDIYPPCYPFTVFISLESQNTRSVIGFTER